MLDFDITFFYLQFLYEALGNLGIFGDSCSIKIYIRIIFSCLIDKGRFIYVIRFYSNKIGY